MEVDVAISSSDNNGIKIVHIKNTSGERLKNTVLGRVFLMGFLLKLVCIRIKCKK